MYAIRGAISAKANTEKDILEATKEIMQNLMQENDLQKEDLISIITTTTDDLTKVYPGKALREIGYNLTPILCMQEMKVEMSSQKMIRLLIHVDGKRDKSQVKHQYLRNAKKLRPDLVE
ncbi:chorismate mutase [Halanaerobium saccharolyticum]|uniref:chorismate mutase n=1 Tax=Halanaerobium saccharolyticum TaxID=43595 RepID=A0A4R7YWW7_9FIRM|nr:chorismate mutase [Halanaerobium saccharolyticum]RAK06200.1 chorismate mutase [Halanaerobium saccharolyticum]TDW00565.1 chorismate mutase [Halanaerobium saccharolyticum]TDX52230.1 chorismate mutase [Halanaerobium saccharolyticum]